MKSLKNVTSYVLAVCLLLTFSFPSNAASPNLSPELTEDIENVHVIKNPQETIIRYSQYKGDDEYYVMEQVNGNSIHSRIYKVSGENYILDSSIDSVISEGQVHCSETNSDGTLQHYTVSAKNIDRNNAPNQDDEWSLLSNNKTYLRTDKYGISLVGKKVTIAIVAGAITAAAPYIAASVATQIVIAAIAAGGSQGVASLPNYLYVTSKVYRTKSSGKIYTRYENKYYLDASRSKYVGSWTFSQRGYH